MKHHATPAACLEHLGKDQRLAPLLLTVEPYTLQKKTNVCVRLCESIMSQQLSVKVADVIFGRFLNLYGGAEPDAAQILATPYERLRAIGLSNAKANYVHNVARYLSEHEANDDQLHAMSDDEVMAFLTAIKGVGRWTVEMFLMFTLGREDIFSTGDLGIQQAMTKLYGLDTADKKKLHQSMLDISAHWAPYRTYACFYLWKYKDGGKDGI